MYSNVVLMSGIFRRPRRLLVLGRRSCQASQRCRSRPSTDSDRETRSECEYCIATTIVPEFHGSALHTQAAMARRAASRGVGARRTKAFLRKTGHVHTVAPPRPSRSPVGRCRTLTEVAQAPHSARYVGTVHVTFPHTIDTDAA